MQKLSKESAIAKKKDSFKSITLELSMSEEIGLLKILEDTARSKEILFCSESVFLGKVKRILNLKDDDIDAYFDEYCRRIYVFNGTEIRFIITDILL